MLSRFCFVINNHCLACVQQKAGSVLEKAQQSSDEQREALQDVTESLGRKEILQHKDKA